MKFVFLLLLLLMGIFVNAISIVRVKTFRKDEFHVSWSKSALGMVEDQVNVFIQETLQDPHHYVCNVQYATIKGYASAMVSVCQKEE